MEECKHKEKPEVERGVIKPCPFCGELPKYEPWCAGHEAPHHWPHQIVHDCKAIGVQMYVRAGRIGLEDTKENVFAAWNKRAL